MSFPNITNLKKASVTSTNYFVDAHGWIYFKKETIIAPIAIEEPTNQIINLAPLLLDSYF